MVRGDFVAGRGIGRGRGEEALKQEKGSDYIQYCYRNGCILEGESPP